MNSRQRVLKAVNFEQADRIPIDLGATGASGINPVVYDKLKKRMGINTPTKVNDTFQMLAEVETEVLERLHADVIPLNELNLPWAGMDAKEGLERQLFSGLKVYFPPQTQIREESDRSWSLLNTEGQAVARMPKDGFYFDIITGRMAGKRIDPKAFKPRDTVTDEALDLLAVRAKYLHENTDKAILGWGQTISMLGMSGSTGSGITQGSLDEWLCMLMAEKDTANEMMARHVDAVIKCMELYHQATGDYCFAWAVGSDDAGTQRGGLVAPELFAEMIKPHYKRLCDWIHTHTNWKTFLHSCGSVYHYISEWIDAGIDILNPVQISAANMEPQRLMNDFAGRIVFWGGGCDTQHVLPLATPDEIREHVKNNISVFSSGTGGYVFNQVHNIQQNVPVENIEAMFETAYECGQIKQ